MMRSSARRRRRRIVGTLPLLSFVMTMYVQDELERYGESVPHQFGGLYVDEGAFVALFTTDLEQHRAALRDRLSGQRGWRVQCGDRTWREVEQANAAVQRILWDTRQYPDVHGIGITMRDGQFVISVGIDPYDSDRADELKHVTQPHPVVIEHQGPFVFA